MGTGGVSQAGGEHKGKIIIAQLQPIRLPNVDPDRGGRQLRRVAGPFGDYLRCPAKEYIRLLPARGSGKRARLEIRDCKEMVALTRGY